MSARGELRATRVAMVTTESDFRDIEKACDAKRRRGTTTVEVDVEALRHLRADHLTLLEALRSRKLIAIVLGEDQDDLRSALTGGDQ